MKCLFRKLLAILFAAIVGGALPRVHAASKPVRVTTEKTAEGWQLRVDGEPFYVKGISCNEAVGDGGEDLLKLVADAGANTVRIYGGVTKDYLDRAQHHRLKVNVGYWFNAIRFGTKESYRDAGHRAALKRSALAYVRKFKSHPAVLTWTVGNEVFRFTELEEEKEAYGRFLEDLVQAIHREDPNHPVIYASAYSVCLPYVKRLAPSVDILGVNVTGGAGAASRWAAQNAFDKPVIVTEFAPLGAWEQRKDVNGMAFDPFDQFKADNYRLSWRQIQENKNCVGGFAFVLGGFRNQDSLTWFNMNHGGLRRAGYAAIHELYSGRPLANQPPKISALQVEPRQGLKGGSRTTMTVQASDRENDPLQYDYFITNIASDPLIVEKPTFFPADPQITSPGNATVKVPTAPGIYRIYASVADGQGNIAIADRTIQVIP